MLVGGDVEKMSDAKLGFTRLPGMYWPCLMLTLLGYGALTLAAE
jgi:hypothetical protein